MNPHPPPHPSHESPLALSTEQRAVVEHGDGPLLVLAGAGTGKTSTLAARIAHLIERGAAKPWQVLAVTFTNKAAREMRQRLEVALGTDAMLPGWLGTFHSLSARMLRSHAEHAGLRNDYSILDADDSRKLVGQIARSLDIDEKQWPDSRLASIIDRWKNRVLMPGNLPEDEAEAVANGRGPKLYEEYCKRLIEMNAADFGDLLVHMVQIFQRVPEIAAHYRDQFQYVLVDEYQDTNTAQHMWLRHLTRPDGNLCCVGDDDQSIYGWRGAQVEHILRFERDFENASIVRLEQNYRSTGHILDVGSTFIAANAGRWGKRLWSRLGVGEKVQVGAFPDGRAEAAWIAEEIERLTESRSRRTLPRREVAILVRATYLMAVIEEQFRWRGIPFEIVGGTTFFNRTEIRDATAYLQLIAQPGAHLAFERIANVPRRGVGAISLAKILEIAREVPKTVDEVVRRALEQGAIRGKGAAGLEGLLKLLAGWRKRRESGIALHELASQVLKESGYMGMWEQSNLPDSQSRLENLRQLISDLAQFETLEAYLDHAALHAAEQSGDEEDRVQIMTMHAAKGLEFDAVFLPAWEDEVFPSPRAIDDAGQRALEEERRLGHVAITRARRHLAITYATNRWSYGRPSHRSPSRFFHNLPDAHVEMLAEGSMTITQVPATTALEHRAVNASAYHSPGWRRLKRNATLATSGVSTRPSPATPNPYGPGSDVFHDKFGKGSVIKTDGSHVVVAFATGEKTVLASYLRESGE